MYLKTKSEISFDLECLEKFIIMFLIINVMWMLYSTNVMINSPMMINSYVWTNIYYFFTEFYLATEIIMRFRDLLYTVN